MMQNLFGMKVCDQQQEASDQVKEQQ